MDSRWFKEDRELPRDEQRQSIEDATDVIKNATIVRRRLQRVLEDEIKKTYELEEKVDAPNYSIVVSHAAGKRKALRDILKLVII